MLPTSTRAPDPLRLGAGSRWTHLEFLDSCHDRCARHSGCSRQQADPTIAYLASLRGYPQSARTLIHCVAQYFEFRCNSSAAVIMGINMGHALLKS
jgi:hypothetical protein